MSVKVSVCIPVYGVEKYIERCARSLFEQTMQDGLELVFVNDCTPDKSIEILERVLTEYPHRRDLTKIINLPENSGVGKARRIAIENCTGEYIIHCDPDDWLELDMYEKMYNAAKENDADIVYCDYIENYPTRELTKNFPLHTNCDTFLKDVLSGTIHCSLCNKLFRNTIAQADDINVPETICLSEDYLCVSQMLLKCHRIVSCGKAYYHYFRARENSYTDPGSYKIEYFTGACEIVNFLKEKLPDHQRKNLANFQAITLFKAVKHKLLPVKDFQKLWSKDRIRILLSPNLHIIKRLVLLSAYISYSGTTSILQYLQKKKEI